MDPLIIGMIVLDQYGALLIDHPADMKVCQEDHGLDTDWNFLYHPCPSQDFDPWPDQDFDPWPDRMLSVQI